MGSMSLVIGSIWAKNADGDFGSSVCGPWKLSQKREFEWLLHANPDRLKPLLQSIADRP